MPVNKPHLEFVDLDNDGWLDLFLTNGHVYPEVARLKTEAAYKQRKVVYRNLGNGRFADVTERLGPPATTPKAEAAKTFRQAPTPAGRRVLYTVRSSRTADASSTRPTTTRTDRHRSAGQPHGVALLQAAHAVEEPAPPPQLGRRAVLDDAAVLKHDQPIEPRHRR